jgi:hypothetical protein
MATAIALIGSVIGSDISPVDNNICSETVISPNILPKSDIDRLNDAVQIGML